MVRQTRSPGPKGVRLGMSRIIIIIIVIIIIIITIIIIFKFLIINTFY